MQLYFYRGAEPNFGDELSDWLMPRVFPDLFDHDPAAIFLGIGSILFDSFPQSARKIVFGSGFGGYTRLPRLDERWQVYCVRGPLTAKALNLAPSTVAGDAAILINRYRPPSRGEQGSISFIPHFDSLRRGHWQQSCALAGIQLIDPRDPVTDIMDRIQASRLVISEAMHGIIVADALRVPWVAVEPIDASHHMKWRDWAGALDLDLAFEPLRPSSMRERRERRRTRDQHARMTEPGVRPAPNRLDGYLHYPRRALEIGLSLADPLCVHDAARGLERAAAAEPRLSTDQALDRALDRLQTAADRIMLDHGRSRYAVGG